MAAPHPKPKQIPTTSKTSPEESNTGRLTQSICLIVPPSKSRRKSDVEPLFWHIASALQASNFVHVFGMNAASNLFVSHSADRRIESNV